jgi:cathepsin B
MVDEINAMRTTWKAEVSTRFANATIADVKMLLGTVLPGEAGYYEPELEKTLFKTTTIPTSFDGRTAWPQCASVIGRVRDQSNCGSCWAFGSTEGFSDRHCIATGKAVVFSAEDTNSCCSGIHCGFSNGCNGGQPSGAWKWFTEHGVSTGLDWAQMNTGESCKPYSMQSCAHHVTPPAGMVACDTLPSYSTPTCTSTCSDSKYTKNSYSSDKVKAKTSYSVKGVENIQKELMEKGTLSVSLTVYEDFEAYKSGVYRHVSGKSLGGHAIKMIGWGVESDGTPYWICVNSWNNSWGEEGIFRILRGSDECGIESGVVTGDF